MLRCLLPLGLILCLWGCSDGKRSAARREAGDFSEAAAVAQLLEEHVPFEFEFDLEDVNGKPLSKKDFAGKVLIVDVWGTWCPPCRMEIPHFVALQRQFGDQGLQVIGLNSEHVRDKEAAARLVRETCREEEIDYPCALLTRAVGRQIPDLQGYPTTLFLDRTGKVRLTAVGYHELSFLQTVVETLLRERPAEVAAPSADVKTATDDRGDR